MRIATFNVENLDFPQKPRDLSVAERAQILRPQLERLRADVLCLQEVHGQDQENGPRTLQALEELLAGTRYDGWPMRSTLLANGSDVERFRNLVTVIRPDYAFEEAREILHEFAPPPQYNVVTDGADTVKDIKWDRPMLYCKINVGSEILHVINVHYKSKNPTSITGQGPTDFKWRTPAGWAEGSFLSAMKRMGAAIETRIFVDQILEAEPDAKVVVLGDFNAEIEEEPMRALRGEVADTGNPDHNRLTLYPCEDSVPKDARFTLYHHGAKNMLDHVMVSRAMITCYLGCEIHNEIVRDESIAFATDNKFPSSDHAPVVCAFQAGDAIA
jgi:endonuclease/exonuclease/phosphatase family metal-dependent hydrolase